MLRRIVRTQERIEDRGGLIKERTRKIVRMQVAKESTMNVGGELKRGQQEML